MQLAWSFGQHLATPIVGQTLSVPEIGVAKVCSECPGCTGSVRGVPGCQRNATTVPNPDPGSQSGMSRQEGGAALRARPEINLRVGGRLESTGLTLYNLHVSTYTDTQCSPTAIPTRPCQGLGRQGGLPDHPLRQPGTQN